MKVGLASFLWKLFCRGDDQRGISAFKSGGNRRSQETAARSVVGGGGGLWGVIDLLEALNVTRSVTGVTRAKGPDPGVPAWKFRQRVPHLTLPWDYSVYLLSTVQGALGFHFVARQSRGSEGTLVSLVSPAASQRDGRPLLRLVSSVRAGRLWLEYRTVHNMEPASLTFPGSNPFAHGRWTRLALNLEPQRVSLFVECQEPIVFEKDGGEEMLSLILPLDLQITFASLAGDKASKFLVRRQLPRSRGCSASVQAPAGSPAGLGRGTE
ncbi:Kielin/chordin-like protein [Varanus komodoensis]|nr:Kielin/chordin-like protein [Varanus komodoensis]